MQHSQFKQVHVKHKVLLSVLSGSLSAWYLARVKSQYCQDMWLLIDKKAKEVKEAEKEMSQK